jgi:hypothetical protein
MASTPSGGCSLKAMSYALYARHPNECLYSVKVRKLVHTRTDAPETCSKLDRRNRNDVFLPFYAVRRHSNAKKVSQRTLCRRQCPLANRIALMCFELSLFRSDTQHERIDGLLGIVLYSI